jgi:hypothetical protein
VSLRNRLIPRWLGLAPQFNSQKQRVFPRGMAGESGLAAWRQAQNGSPWPRRHAHIAHEFAREMRFSGLKSSPNRGKSGLNTPFLFTDQLTAPFFKLFIMRYLFAFHGEKQVPKGEGGWGTSLTKQTEPISSYLSVCARRRQFSASGVQENGQSAIADFHPPHGFHFMPRS